MILAALAGIIFALGLAIADMTSPSRVVGFLDVTGAWDPTLAFVMLGAIAVYAPFVRLAKRRNVFWPTETAIDARLVIGAAIFGVGWGLSGYCPGPALVSVGGAIQTGAFVLAMIAGIAVTSKYLSRARQEPALR
jgi:uncharacterized membrane protein YedE/YeeE